MDLTFGARLRLQRERQQVALAMVAEQTKIRITLLERLERDDVSGWPQGVFRRAYIRTYAQAIGLEPDAVVREFLELYPDPGEEIATIAAATEGTERASTGRRPPTRLRFLIGSAMSALPGLRPSPPREGSAAEKRTVADDAIARPVGSMALGGELACVGGIQVDTADDRPLRLEVEHDVALPDVHGAPTVSPSDVSAAADRARSGGRAPVAIDLSAVAQLCTRLARAADARDLAPVLEDAATLLDAVGMIVWMWDPTGGALRPVLSHGYSDAVLAQLAGVSPDGETAIGAAFQSGETQVVDGSVVQSGALVIPLTTPTTCGGVLALELRHGGEQRESVRACASIVAAQLSMLAGDPPAVHAAIA